MARILVAWMGIILAVNVGCERHVAIADPELWRNNPSRAERELLGISNPDLEVVGSDEKAGTITLRDRRTGTQSTITLEDARKGKTGLGWPAWVPQYSGFVIPYVKEQPHASTVPHDEAGGFGFSTDAGSAEVINFYRKKAEEMGMQTKLMDSARAGRALLIKSDIFNSFLRVETRSDPNNRTSVELTYARTP